MPSDRSSKLCTEIVPLQITASRVSSVDMARPAGESVCQWHLQTLSGDVRECLQSVSMLGYWNDSEDDSFLQRSLCLKPDH